MAERLIDELRRLVREAKVRMRQEAENRDEQLARSRRRGERAHQIISGLPDLFRQAANRGEQTVEVMRLLEDDEDFDRADITPHQNSPILPRKLKGAAWQVYNYLVKEELFVEVREKRGHPDGDGRVCVDYILVVEIV